MIGDPVTTKIKMTAAEFAQLPETMLPTELIDGELIVTPAPKDDHQKVIGKFHFVVLWITIQHLPDAEVRLAPCDVYLDEINAIQPDLFIVRKDNEKCRLGDDGYWYGPPDLIIEIVSTSPSSVQRDKIDKFRLYERHGVLEYWLVDPVNQYVEVFRLSGKKFQFQGVYKADESFESAVLEGQTVDLKTIFGE